MSGLGLQPNPDIVYKIALQKNLLVFIIIILGIIFEFKFYLCAIPLASVTPLM